MTDESIMPFGKHKGEKLANVPPSYMMWLHENGNTFGELKAYLLENEDVFKAEIQQLES